MGEPLFPHTVRDLAASFHLFDTKYSRPAFMCPSLSVHPPPPHPLHRSLFVFLSPFSSILTSCHLARFPVAFSSRGDHGSTPAELNMAAAKLQTPSNQLSNYGPLIPANGRRRVETNGGPWWAMEKKKKKKIQAWNRVNVQVRLMEKSWKWRTRFKVFK